MNASTLERSEFAPPPPRGLGRALVLALLAHGLLILALTWGLRWQRDAQEDAVEAELWSPTVQRAAPPPAVAPTPAPAPQPEPVAKAPPPPPKPQANEARDAEIALAQKKKQEEEARRAAQQEQERKLAEKKAAEEKKRKDEEQRKLAEQKKAEAERKAAAAREARESEARRKNELARLSRLAGAGTTEGGSAARDAGPSGSYAGRIRAAVRPNIVFTDDVTGNPVAEVEVRTGPTGEIISRRITRSSGVPRWDEAVLRALDRTQKLPSDNGRYWNPMLITFKPRD